MPRHPIFICNLILLILVGIQQLRADDRLPPKPRTNPAPESSYDQITGNYLPYKPVKNTPGKILQQWSAASRLQSPVTPRSKVEEFKKRNQAYFSGHELALISEFQQPVTTQTLLKDYDWQLIQHTKTKIILRGQPRDQLTRHLCRAFELQVNPQSMLPEALTFLTDPAKQHQSFASIELTAYKILQPKTLAETNTHPQSVLHTVAKTVFLSDGKQQSSTSANGPIKQISFSPSSSESKNRSELREIEKLVSRWIAESQRIDSIRLSNGATIFKLGDNRPAEVPVKLRTKSDGTLVSGWHAFLRVLPLWLIDVDQNTFIIESFAIELLTNDSAPSAPRLITLRLKRNPDSPPRRIPGGKWDTVEIEFNSHQPLPVKITETKNNWVSEFLLSDMQVQYKK